MKWINLLWITLAVAAASTLLPSGRAGADGGHGVPDRMAALQAQLDEQKKAIQSGDAALQGQLNEQKQAILALQAQLDNLEPVLLELEGR